MPTDSPILDAARDEFQKIKRLADMAIAQLNDAQLHDTIDAEANSVAILMRHMAGNMRSRWVGFLTEDGEKATRQRDREFVESHRDARGPAGRVGARLAVRVRRARDRSPTPTCCEPSMIRGEPHTVIKAIGRQTSHYAGHAYQILLLAKHVLGPDWKTLSIPRGQSEEFNRRMLAKLKGA